MRAILRLGPEQELSESFSAERVDGRLKVVLRRADGEPIGERLLPDDGTCDELAQAAAVVLAVWLTDVHPDFARDLPLAAQPEPDVAPELPQRQQPASKSPAPPPPRAVMVRRGSVTGLRPSTPIERTYRFELSLAAGLQLSPGSLGPAGMASIGAEPRREGLGVRLSALANWPTTTRLGPGEVKWFRAPAALGATWRLAVGRLSWDFDAGPTLGWLHLRGRSFDREQSADALAVGGFALARISSSSRAWTPFAAAGAFVWPATSIAYVTGTDAELVLPKVDWLLAFGLTIAP